MTDDLLRHHPMTSERDVRNYNIVLQRVLRFSLMTIVEGIFGAENTTGSRNLRVARRYRTIKGY
eukprot:11187760-Ditylum_brightwellii.AAC.1